MSVSPIDAPLTIAALAGRRVALWGWGREGHAAYRALRMRLPDQPLVLFCGEAEVADAQALADPLLQVEHRASGERLAAFEVVVKSPGVSPYKPEVLQAGAQHHRAHGPWHPVRLL